MTIKDKFVTRRERRINAKIEMQARGAAEIIIKRVSEGREPPYRFNALHAPASLRQDDYSFRVGQRAVALARAEITCPVDYNHEASQQASTEFEAIKPYHIANGTLPTPPGTILVFTKIPEQTQS